MITSPGRYLTALQGVLPRTTAVTRRLLPAVADSIEKGMVCHEDANGRAALGCPAGATPLFAYANHDTADVTASSPVMGVDGTFGFIVGGASGLELFSSQYDDGGTYPVNTPLKAGADGKLAVGVEGTDPIVGRVSRGGVTSHKDLSGLAFYPARNA